MAALGGFRPAAPGAVAHARRLAARARRRAGPAQRARPVHPAPGGRLHLGGTGIRDHRVQPRREGRLLRPGRRQGLPPPHLLRGTRRGEAPVRFDDVLGLGDDALIAAQRLAQWCARAPELEEDVALANIALDQLGAARLLLTYAGELEGRGRDEDALAYLRTDREYRNVLLVELPDRDFAVLMAKLLFLSAYQLDHSALWTVRLGDGTGESHRRMQDAVDEVWPYTHELLSEAPHLRDAWLSTVDDVLADATLQRPDDAWKPGGGRAGRHTEALSYLLAEMQVLHRAHPGARW